jgi:hypothetical protein
MEANSTVFPSMGMGILLAVRTVPACSLTPCAAAEAFRSFVHENERCVRVSRPEAISARWRGCERS